MSVKKHGLFSEFLMRSFGLFILIFIGFFTLGYSQSAQAASSGSCWVSVNKLGFGAVNSKGATSSTSATVNCNHYGHTKPVNVALCFYIPEGNPTLANNRRRIISNTWEFAYLSYDLFYDSALSQRVDTQVNPSSLRCTNKVIAVGEDSAVYSIPIYGKIYEGQNVKADGYNSYSIPFILRYAFSEEKTSTVTEVITANQTNTNNLVVDANYENSCSLYTTPDLNFGQVSDLKQAITGSTAILLSCPTNTNWKVSLDNGLNYNGSSRQMKNGSYYIPYVLYRSADQSQLWDSNAYSQGVGNNGTQQIQIYGRVPSQSNQKPAGDYIDTITVTLTY